MTKMKRGQEKAMFANFHKGQEVRIKEGEEEGNFGKITEVFEEKGRKLLQIKLDKLGNRSRLKGRSITKEPEEIKTIRPVNLEPEFFVASDFEGKEEEWFLSTDEDAQETKQFISDERKDDFDSFFVKIKNGDIEEAYGVSTSGAFVMDNSPVTRLETASERLERVIV